MGDPAPQIIKCCFSLLLALVIARPVVGNDQEKLADVVTGWEQNRRLIGDVFLCEFTVDVYCYSDVDTPVLLYTQSGVWARHGEFQRYSLHCKVPPKISADESAPQKLFSETPPRTDGMGGGGPCGEDEHYLQCHDAQLRYLPLLSTANIYEGVKYSRGITTTPVSYGMMGANEYRNLPELIKDTADRDGTKIQVTLAGDSRIDEAFVLSTTRRDVSSGIGWDNIMVWRVDPKSGFLPLEVTSFDTPDVWACKTTVTEVRKIESGAYWPFSVQMVSNPNSVFPRTFQLKTTRLSFDAEEVDSKLALPVPPGTKIYNPDKMRSSFVYEKQEIRPQELTGLLLQCTMTQQRRNGMGREDATNHGLQRRP